MTITTIPFGKYKGKTYEEMLKLNPQYLQWAHDHLTGFNLSLDQQKEVDDAAEVQLEIQYARQERFAHGRGFYEDPDYDDTDGPYSNFNDLDSWR